MRKVIVNTTPLIALADIGSLDLLKNLYGEIIIPEAVKNEIVSEPAKSLVLSATWIKQQKVHHIERKELFSSRLHSGEIEVMLLADEEKADLLIIDDNTAKKTAKYLGFNVTGTMGVLLKAKQNGLIDKVEPLLNQIVEDGFFIDTKTKEYILKSAKEL